MVVPSRLTLLVFLTMQAFDGVFTYVGVHAFGVAIEANLLLATWIGLVGPAPALLGAKIMAAGCGVLLYARGIHRTLALLTAIYALGAIVPWLLIYRGM